MADSLGGELGVHINISGEEKIKQLTEELKNANALSESLNQRISSLENTISNSEDVAHVEQLNRDLNTLETNLEKIRGKLDVDFSAFLRTNNLDSFRFGDFSDYFDDIEDGTMSLKQAMAQVTKDFNLNTNVDDYLNRFSEKIDEILPKLRELVQNGGGGTGSGNPTIEALSEITRGDYSTLQPLVDSLTNLAASSSDTPRVIADMFTQIGASQGGINPDLIGSVSGMLQGLAGATQNINNLSSISNFFNSFAKVKDLKVSKAGLVNLAENLPKIATANFTELTKLNNINWKSLESLKVSKAALENLSTYLPQIAAVDTKALSKISKIDWTKISQISVNKGSIDNLRQMLTDMTQVAAGANSLSGAMQGLANAFNQITNASGAKNAKTNDYAEISSDMGQIYRVQNKLSKAMAEGNIYWDAQNKIYATADSSYQVLTREANNLLLSYKNLSTTIQNANLTDSQKDALERRRINNLKNLQIATEEYNRAASNKTQSEANRTTAEQERQRVDNIKELINLQMRLDKTASRSTSVSTSGFGLWTSNASEYDEDVVHIQNLYSEFEKLGIVIEEVDGRYKISGQSVNKLGLDTEEYNNLLKLVEDSLRKVNDAHRDNDKSAGATWDKARLKLEQYLSREKDTISNNPAIKAKVAELEDMLAAGGDAKNLEEFNKKLHELNELVVTSSASSQTFYQRFQKAFGSRLRSMISGLIIGSLTRYLREIYTNVSNVNAALTQLKIVTRASDDQMNTFFENAVAQAKELGAAVTDILKQMETFSRLGYNLKDSSILSKYATILSNVAGVSSEEATKGLTSIIKGFNFDVSQTEHISDVLIKVGQEYAVSASELMEAYEKAGAALYATGTSYEKSAALIAAANAAVQDSSVVGTALKTISARIRKSKTDLDELGESMDDLAGSVSAYAGEIKNLTGFNILVEGTTDTYKDLYDIFLGLSKEWNNLSETSQARVAEILGGTRQYQVISSILSNMGDAMGAYSSAMNSAGESARANGIYVDSIAGKIAQLKSSFTELSTTILSSDLVNIVVNTLKTVVNILDSILGFGNGLGTIGVAAGVSIAGVVKLIDKIKALVLIEQALIAEQKGVEISAIATGDAFLSWASKGIVGVITFIPRLITALVGYVWQNKIAKTSTRSLTEALKMMKISSAGAAGAFIALGVAVFAGIGKIFQSIGEAREREYQALKEKAQSLREEADSLDAEADELSNLHERLVEAHGDREKLANLYDELNRKIGISTDLLSGEEGAYRRANAELEQQIAYTKELAAEKRKQSVDKYKSAFSKNKAVAKHEFLFGLIQVDAFAPDWSGEDMRELAKESREYGWWDYDRNLNGVNEEDWKNYWDEQSDTALKAYEDYISEHGDKGFGLVGLSDAIDYFVRGGDDWDELFDETEKYIDDESELLSLVDDYYKAYESGNGKQFADSRKAIDDYIEYLKKEYPFLKEYVEKFKDSLQIGIDALDIPDTLTENQIKEKVDAYKKLIDIRKKLLKSYKEELDYQKKLAQKEKELTRLQQKYSVAILDTSAAGKARARSLAEEVTKSQEELDDITLDHAIDLITEDLDKQLEEYENLISGKLDNIQAGVDSVADVAASIAKTGLKIGTSDFWKYVETNPIAMIAQGFKSTTEQVINSPLFEVTIEGNATEETVEKIEEIADVVVEKLKRGLGSLFGRTGYKGSPKPALQ